MTSLTSESGGSSTTSAYPRQTVIYKTTATGLEITADVFVGTRDTAQCPRRPAILWIHGGGLIFGTKAWMPVEQLKRYLAQGWAVVSMDHRLAPESKVPQILEDSRDAWTWITTSPQAADEFHIDPDQIAVVGHSAGGYLALYIGTLFATTAGKVKKPKAVVSVYGFGDVTGEWISQPSTDFQPGLRKISRQDTLGCVGTMPVASDNAEFDPDGRPRFFFYCKQTGSWIRECFGVNLEDQKMHKSSFFDPFEPIRNMTSDYPPTLLVHGDKDNDVPVTQSIALQQRLDNLNVPVEFIRNTEWPHLFDHDTDDPSVQKCLDQLLEFLKKYLP